MAPCAGQPQTHTGMHELLTQAWLQDGSWKLSCCWIAVLWLDIGAQLSWARSLQVVTVVLRAYLLGISQPFIIQAVCWSASPKEACQLAPDAAAVCRCMLLYAADPRVFPAFELEQAGDVLRLKHLDSSAPLRHSRAIELSVISSRRICRLAAPAIKLICSELQGQACCIHTPTPPPCHELCSAAVRHWTTPAAELFMRSAKQAQASELHSSQLSLHACRTRSRTSS